MPVGGAPPPGDRPRVGAPVRLDDRVRRISERIERIARERGQDPYAFAMRLRNIADTAGLPVLDMLEELVFKPAGRFSYLGNGIHLVNRFGQALRIGYAWQFSSVPEMHRMGSLNWRLVDTKKGPGVVFASTLLEEADRNWQNLPPEPVELLLGCEAAVVLAHDARFVLREGRTPFRLPPAGVAELLNCLCETLIAPAMRLERGEPFEDGATVLHHPIEDLDFSIDLTSNWEEHWKSFTQGQLARRGALFGARLHQVELSRDSEQPVVYLNFCLLNTSSGYVLDARHLVASGKHVEEQLSLAQP